jgi:hypothetical protein
MTIYGHQKRLLLVNTLSMALLTFSWTVSAKEIYSCRNRVFSIWDALKTR